MTMSIQFALCCVVCLGGCVHPGPPPGPGTPTTTHRKVIGRVIGTWAFDFGLPGVPETCYRESNHIRVWVGNTEPYRAFCGAPLCGAEISPCLGACFDYWCPSALKTAQPGIVLSKDNPYLVAHEAVHWASACILGTVDAGHAHKKLWDDATDYDTLEERVWGWIDGTYGPNAAAGFERPTWPPD